MVSWIKYLPLACWSTFWESTFKQQLGCGFDIMDSILSFFFVFWYMQLYMSWYIISFFGFIFNSQIMFFIFSSTPVLTFSIDVVCILPIERSSSCCPSRKQTVLLQNYDFCRNCWIHLTEISAAGRAHGRQIWDYQSDILSLTLIPAWNGCTVEAWELITYLFPYSAWRVISYPCPGWR